MLKDLLLAYFVLGLLWWPLATNFFRENTLPMLFVVPFWLPATIYIYIQSWRDERAIQRYYRQLRNMKK